MVIWAPFDFILFHYVRYGLNLLFSPQSFSVTHILFVEWYTYKKKCSMIQILRSHTQLLLLLLILFSKFWWDRPFGCAAIFVNNNKEVQSGGEGERILFFLRNMIQIIGWKLTLYLEEAAVLQKRLRIYLPGLVSIDKIQYQQIYVLTSYPSNGSLSFLWVIWVLSFHLKYSSILFYNSNNISLKTKVPYF